MIFQALCVYLLAVNLVLFAMMGIRERTLFLTAILGGSVGGILGMKLFRHKTKHNSFKFGFPAILILQLAAAGYLIYQFA